MCACVLKEVWLLMLAPDDASSKHVTCMLHVCYIPVTCAAVVSLQSKGLCGGRDDCNRKGGVFDAVTAEQCLVCWCERHLLACRY
jgi:hypothetical protein